MWSSWVDLMSTFYIGKPELLAYHKMLSTIQLQYLSMALLLEIVQYPIHQQSVAVA